MPPAIRRCPRRTALLPGPPPRQATRAHSPPPPNRPPRPAPVPVSRRVEPLLRVVQALRRRPPPPRVPLPPAHRPLRRRTLAALPQLPPVPAVAAQRPHPRAGSGARGPVLRITRTHPRRDRASTPVSLTTGRMTEGGRRCRGQDGCDLICCTMAGGSADAGFSPQPFHQWPIDLGEVERIECRAGVPEEGGKRRPVAERFAGEERELKALAGA